MNKIHIKYPSRKMTALLLTAAVSFTALQPSYASSRKSQAQDAKKTAENNLNSVKNNIDNITARQQDLQKEINALDAELVDLLVNIDILSDELDTKELQIKQANKDLKAAKQEEATQYERMKKRIRYMYERGDDSMFEALLGASSMADFLNRVTYCNEVYDYDRDQLDVYKETKQAVADLKTQLEAEQSELEEMQENYKLQEKELKSMVAKKEASMDDFDSQLTKAKILAAAYKDTIQEQNQIIRDEEEKERIAAEEAARAAAEAERIAREAAAAAAAEAERAAREAAERAAREAAERAAAQTPSNNTSSGSSNNSYNTGTAVSPSGATGSDVISYATQFIGNPYVWGGTSLTNGADCSGFVMSVYAHFGYSLPHSSAAMASCGRGVSYSEAQPGDLICYSGHVALYMGGGTIVGAQSTQAGITTQNATYRTIIAVRRIIN